MLTLNHISITFNKNTIDEKEALHNLSLTVEDGEFVTVVGGNGSGKSTLMNIISGAVCPDNGTIQIDGKDVTHLSEYKRARYLGRVFQDPKMGTAGEMTIAENLAIASRRGKNRTLSPGLTRKEKENYRDVLSQLGLGLEDRLSSQIGTLSGGQRQTVTLLMATMTKPKILLLDEHTAALDPKTARKTMKITEKIVTENRLTTLMITHNMNDAVRYGTRLIMIHNGKIVLDVKGEEKKLLSTKDLTEQFLKVTEA